MARSVCACCDCSRATGTAADAETVPCDLERGEELRPHVGTADACVFAAGAGGRYSFGREQ